MESSIASNAPLVHSRSSLPCILQLIAEVTDLRFACVAHHEGGGWTACAVIDGIGLGMKTGDELETATVLCGGIHGQQTQIVVDKASEDGRFRDLPGPRFESCISVPLYVQGSYFGALCALDPLPGKASNPKIVAMMQRFAALISLQLEIEKRLEDNIASSQEREAAAPREQSTDALNHDLHILLASIIVGADVLLSRPLDMDSRSVVERIHRSGHRLSDAIRDATVAIFNRIERRRNFLMRVQEHLHGLADPDRIMAAGVEMLGQYIDADRCGYMEAKEGGESFQTLHEWHRHEAEPAATPATPAAQGEPDMFCPALVSELRQNRPVIINDAQASPLTSGAGVQAVFESGTVRAAICAPLGKSGQLVAVLYLGQNTPRRWSAEETLLVQEIAERIRTAAERARVEQEKNRAEELLQDGMRVARMAVWEWGIATKNFRLSDNAPLIFGCAIKSMESIWEALHPEDLERLKGAHRRAIEKRDGYREVVRFTRPDTRQAVWLDMHARVRCDASGEPSVLRGVIVDVSERMRAQSELARLNQALTEQVAQLEKARSRQAIELRVADVLRGIQEPGKIFAETGRLLGEHLRVARVVYGDYDIEKKLITFHSNYTDGTVAEIRGSYPTDIFGAGNFAWLEAGRTWVSDDMIHDPRTADPGIWPAFEALDIRSGIAVPLSRHGMLIACLFINEGRARKWTDDEIKLVEDVAERAWSAIERVRAEEALRQEDRRKDQFLAMLAHELRNPLAPIRSAAQLLKRVGMEPERIRSISDIIARQVSHMTGLINDLLDVSRVTRGLVVLDRNEVDMKRVVADAVEQARPLIDARHHHISVQTGPDSACVTGDHKRLVQVLANLLSNAAKYTPAGGNIQVRLESAGDRVALRVADNGAGMPPELIPNVFELFAQGARTPDRSQGGLGLGLTLVKNLVELHGGKVAAFSKGLNAGSEFVVDLPRSGRDRTERERAPEEGAGATAPEMFGGMNLLVVDDNADAAEALAMLLEMNGHRVATEHDPYRALERARRETFDACLLDIGLPGMDGNELARRLRAMPETERILLIAITGYGQQYEQAKSMEAGFNHYFVKPVDLVKLFALLGGVRAVPS